MKLNLAHKLFEMRKMLDTQLVTLKRVIHKGCPYFEGSRGLQNSKFSFTKKPFKSAMRIKGFFLLRAFQFLYVLQKLRQKLQIFRYEKPLREIFN